MEPNFHEAQVAVMTIEHEQDTVIQQPNPPHQVGIVKHPPKTTMNKSDSLESLAA